MLFDIDGVLEQVAWTRPDAGVAFLALDRYYASDRQDRFGNLYIYEGWAAVRTAHGRNRLRVRDDDYRFITILDILFKMD